MSNPYRAPEMYPDLPKLSQPRRREDDVIRQAGTMAALLLAVGLLFGATLLLVGSTYGPSRIVQSEAPIEK